MQSGRQYTLTIIQQPRIGYAFCSNVQDRLPLEPALMLQVGLYDEHGNECQSRPTDLTFLVAHVSLWSTDGAEDGNDTLSHCSIDKSHLLLGNTVSSVESSVSNDQNHFLFDDLSIKEPGEYRLAIALFDIKRNILFGEQDTQCTSTVFTDRFEVVPKTQEGRRYVTHLPH
ncbi:hypothetical protein K493DRAFT_310175 [Basidiobolus meristosporus CBS 931.73]|uniref:Velvet domain-containing protein n=1 Tax=Basidiobolus meristosporus CBS 931.73 TaxID=1314790 RepID=A0A1Y1ZBZ0_9FUNG|nr:hypothetical protein K493DRAFT_310175 [Basidiobolus meristosporus CBS 931.73]|eukprot:ORY07644.1 hypothetical protein K493DRAFT_310175 [Basidiobolus meristosporus CBS 931.73]